MIARRGLGSTLLLLAVTAGCGTDGTTPRCDDYPLPYDVRIPARRAEVWEKLSAGAAEPDACTIVPAGYEGAVGGGAGLGGAGGSGGVTAGSAGDAGAMTASAGDGAGGSPE